MEINPDFFHILSRKQYSEAKRLYRASAAPFFKSEPSHNKRFATYSKISREYDWRVTILESLSVRKSPEQIIAWFVYKKTQVYSTAKMFRESVSQKNVMADRAKHKKRSNHKRNKEYVSELKQKKSRRIQGTA